MTDNIKPTVQEQTAWAKVPQEFNDWWNSDYSDESNPFRINSAAYWAWAGWSEAVRLNAQPAQPLTDEKEALDLLNAENNRLTKLVIELRAETVRMNAQTDAKPIYQLQLVNGGWIDQTRESYEYNKANGIKGLRIVYEATPAAPQPAQPLDAGVMELAESVGLIGPSSRTHDLHEAIQRFHDLIVVNASIKAALNFADSLAQPLTDKWQPIETAPKDVMVLLYSPEFLAPAIGKWDRYCKYNHPYFTHWIPLPAPPKD